MITFLVRMGQKRAQHAIVGALVRTYATGQKTPLRPAGGNQPPFQPVNKTTFEHLR